MYIINFCLIGLLKIIDIIPNLDPQFPTGFGRHVLGIRLDFSSPSAGVCWDGD